MTKWEFSADMSEEGTRGAPDLGRRSLTRLRWGLRAAALAGLGLFELYHAVVLHGSRREVLLDLTWGALLSLGLIQICFSVIFRLCDQAVAYHQHRTADLARRNRLYGVGQRLMAALQTEPIQAGSTQVSHERLEGALTPGENELSSALKGLSEVFDVQRGSLLLLGEAGQIQKFVPIGLPAGIKPGPQPDSFPVDDAPGESLDSDPWIAFLMPGVKHVGAFCAVPIRAGRRHRGFLALARGKAFTAQDQSLLHAFATNLGMILENALLIQNTQQKLVEAAAVAEMSHAISTRLTQEDLLPYLAENLARIVDGSSCFIVLRHSHTEELELAAAFGPLTENDPSFLTSDGYGSFTRAVMAAGEPIVIEDVHDSAFVSAQAAKGLPDQSLLGLPLAVQNQVVGVVIIGESREKRRFSEEKVGRAMVVVNQGAIAIANARLFRETEQRLIELGTLAEISRVLYSPLDSRNIYQKMVDELARAFGYPFVAVYQVEGEGLELGAQAGYVRGSPPARIPLGQSLIGEAAATGETGYVLDTSALPEHETVAEGIVSQIALPLRKNGQVLGVLSVESYARLTEADLSLLQSLSYQVSTAVENARLYAAEQREREVARTLLQIAGDLSGTLQLQEVLYLILGRLGVVVPYESAAIGLLAGDVCYVAAAHDLPRAERLWGARISPDDLPLVARVLHGGMTVIVDDTHASDDWVVHKGGEDIRAWLGVPLVVQDRTIGLLMLNHVTPGFYGPEAARLALAFAQHAALAIDNARLYEQTQAKLREQTLLHELTTAVTSTLDAGRVLRLLTERLVAVLGITSARIATLDDGMESANLVAEHCAAEANESEKASRVGEVYELAAFPVTTATLMEREPLLITLGDGPDEWHETIKQSAGQTMLLIPLVARDRVTGFVELWDSRSRRRFTEAEIALAQTLINPAAVAIENARLFAQTQRSISEMMLLYDIAVAAASTLELDTILQSVVKTLQFRLLERSAVSVWLLGVEEDVLRLRARAGELEGVQQTEMLQLDQGLCGQVMRSGQPILVSDAQDLRDADYGPMVRSVLCVPLAWGERSVGALLALSTQEDAFSSHDLRLLRTMAGNLAAAIQNVRLFNQLKRSEEALVLRNRALEQANDRLQELDRLKSAFITSVSHELRTPLNSIIGFSEVLLDGLAGDLRPLAEEYMGYIHGSGKHLLNLIDDILDLSRIQAGRMALSLDEVDVMAVVEEVRATLAPMVTQKEQVLTVAQEEALPTIVADRFRLKQILLNLVGNACKFTQNAGQISVQASCIDQDTLRLDVVDNGPGIALEDHFVIFEEFRQARETRPGEGTGLGLAITRRLVELHGGRIWVESELGAGATFTVLFPVAGPEPAESGQREEMGGKVGAIAN